MKEINKMINLKKIAYQMMKMKVKVIGAKKKMKMFLNSNKVQK